MSDCFHSSLALLTIKTRQENIEEKLKDAKAIGGDLKSFIRSTTINTLEDFDFVTTQEFKTQKAILERAEEKIKQLEQKITELQTGYKF